jgi:hypothetical protein
VPLASGYLKAYAVARGRAGESDIRIAPSRLTRHGGDEAVLQWIAEAGASLIGFSVSLWNLQRSLFLARRIRKLLPSARVIIGGPEVADGQPVLEDPSVDACVIGEGEQAFALALHDLREGRPLRRLYKEEPLAELSAVPNPYLSGAMEREIDEPLYLETMRGCPYRCAYCCYGKAYPRVRTFPRPRIAEIFALALRTKAPEIYFMDPCFNFTPGWERTLQTIASLNTSGIPLHTEIRLESITVERAALFAAAGFRSVEVGLQSVNERALRAVGRSWERAKFTAGARLLKEAGVTVKTGVILGLPEDTPEEFQETMEFLEEHDLAEDMEIYPLCVLPGTRLRDEAKSLGISFMDGPPYWVLSTPTMSQSDLIQAIRGVEESRGIEFFPPIVPNFSERRGEYLGFLDLRRQGSVRRAAGSAEVLANALTLLIDAAQLSDPSPLEDLGRRLRQRNPFCLYHLVVAGDEPLDERVMEGLAEAFFFPGHYFNMVHSFSEDPQGRFSVRLYRLASRLDSAERAMAEEPWETILRWSAGLLPGGRRLLEQKPLLLIDGEPGAAEEEELATTYRGFEGLLLRAGRRILD